MRKKLFAILMSAMMMVTFIPAMAFAGTVDDDPTLPYAKVTYSADYTTVTATYYAANGTAVASTAPLTTVRDFSSQYGYTKVYVDETTITNYFNKYVGNASADAAMKTELETYYTSGDANEMFIYDFADAEVYSGGNVLPVSVDYTLAGRYFDFDSTTKAPKLQSTLGISLKKPSYATLCNGVTPTALNSETTVLTSFSGGWGATAKVTGLTYGSVDAQTATVTVTLSQDHTNRNTHYVVKNSPITKTVSIGQGAKTIDQMYFTFDGVANTNKKISDDVNVEAVYDGAEHTIGLVEVAGVTPVIKKYDSVEGTYKVVDSITYKNPTTATEYYEVTVKSGAKTYTSAVSVAVGKATVAKVGLNTKAVSGKDVIQVPVYEGDSYDPYDFLLYKATSSANNTEAASIASAIKAHADLLKAYAKTKVTVTATPTVMDKSVVDVVVAERNLTKAPLTAEEKQVQKDVEALFQYTIFATGQYTYYDGLFFITENEDGVLNIMANDKVNEIDFIGTAKTVHVKKAKAVKKAVKKTVKAESLSSVAPTFKKLSGNKKITVASNGEMTIKKGLKKGTYKVKVKASVAAGKGYKYASATQVYTVKVVK